MASGLLVKCRPLGLQGLSIAGSSLAVVSSAFPCLTTADLVSRKGQRPSCWEQAKSMNQGGRGGSGDKRSAFSREGRGFESR